jgi:membrane-associated PAP2 superfamily phosphatase
MSLPWPRWYQWHKAWDYRRLWIPELAVAVLLIIVAVVLSHVPWGDRAIIRLVYEPSAEHPWPLSKEMPWRAFNRYAGIGAALMALVALALIVRSYFVDHWRRQRVHLLYLLLVIAIGPGLVVNAALKELWGRPRPRQVQEFGGWLPYRSIVQPDKPGRGKSFPCGHCSASFTVVALYFIWRRRHRALAAGSLGVAVFLGGGMSAARVLSGAHFPSDALMAGALVFIVAAFLYYAVLNIPAREDCGAYRAVCPGWPLLAGSAALVALIAVGGALAIPAHRTIWYDGRLTAVRDARPVIRLEIEHADVTLRFGPYDDLAVRGHTEGFRGIGGSMKDVLFWTPNRAAPTQLTYRLNKKGLFSEFRTTVTAHVPVAAASGLSLVLQNCHLHLIDPPPPGLPVAIEMTDGRIEAGDAWHNRSHRFQLRDSRILDRGNPIPPPPIEICCP